MRLETTVSCEIAVHASQQTVINFSLSLRFSKNILGSQRNFLSSSPVPDDLLENLRPSITARRLTVISFFTSAEVSSFRNA
jgi:hypothetical protein